MKKKSRSNGSGHSRAPRREHQRLEVGQLLRDGWDRTGTVLDFACQYAHPKADPVYSYLVRWDDGQVQAVSEAAIDGDHGIQRVD